ncbi:hypothetical protein XENTR_v10017940 [Xenopus tropicalis]|uniref:Taste receptor type 2 n=1 Tax=Xenopus tropicalis TaxID=8364 RepID=Q2AB45_XENTR|nr:bitter taste receptor 42 [Xenopus tropicalis]KAE8590089.1 hypothetical protein XENTR_v10017940 [Xenopus tropicalis]BAE80422.1 bitter taste receptor [Xenopus tropicalis]|eukprot:NP_001165497.1 bitter taste receptor 42 [Xenopus tropicalis]
MRSAVQMVIMAFDCIALIVGGLGDVVVLALCVLERSRKRVLCPYRVISLSVSISNLTAIFLQLASDNELLPNTLLVEYVDLLSVSFLCSNLWFSTLLYVYYSIKIGARRLTFYTWLNAKFPTILPYLLFSLLTMSLLTSFIFLLQPLDNPPNNFSSVPTNYEEAYLENPFIKSGFTQSLIALICFLISFILVGQILLSLYRHVRHVQSNNEAAGNFSLEAHFKAAKTLTILLVFNVTFFVSMITTLLSPSPSMPFAVSCIFIAVSLSTQPYILILGNTNMKKQAKETFLPVFMNVAN